MIQPITLIGAAVCIGSLVFRYKMEEARKAASSPEKIKPRTVQQQWKTAKVLFGALATFLSIQFALEHLNQNLSGTTANPSLLERIITLLGY